MTSPTVRRGVRFASAPSPFGGNMVGAVPPSFMADIELTLPARAENVAVVRHAIGGLGEALHPPPPTLSHANLAPPPAGPHVRVHPHAPRGGPAQVGAGHDTHPPPRLLR